MEGKELTCLRRNPNGEKLRVREGRSMMVVGRFREAGLER